VDNGYVCGSRLSDSFPKAEVERHSELNFGQNMASTTHFLFWPHSLAALLLFTAVAARGEVDLAGNWRVVLHEDIQERGAGPDIGDYLGMPLNDEARSRADQWQSASQGLPERQCILYTNFYLVQGPSNIFFSALRDPYTGRVKAWVLNATVDRGAQEIWMDGRSHPSPHALHTDTGFATGEWEGDILTVKITHMKVGVPRRNGVPSSDQAMLTEHFIRHGDLLTLVAILEDPIYLTEPYIKSTTFRLDPTVLGGFGGAWNDPCEPQTEVPRPRGSVPHYLPGQNPAINQAEFATAYHLPTQTVRGGAETMYPEYQKKLGGYVPPEKCERYCDGGLGNRAVAPPQNPQR